MPQQDAPMSFVYAWKGESRFLFGSYANLHDTIAGMQAAMRAGYGNLDVEYSA